MFSWPTDLSSRGNENRGTWKTSIQSRSANLSSRTTFHVYWWWYRLCYWISFHHRKTRIRIESIHRKYVFFCKFFFLPIIKTKSFHHYSQLQRWFQSNLHIYIFQNHNSILSKKISTHYFIFQKETIFPFHLIL